MTERSLYLIRSFILSTTSYEIMRRAGIAELLVIEFSIKMWTLLGYTMPLTDKQHISHTLAVDISCNCELPCWPSDNVKDDGDR